ncbi:MAG: hypothetical protein SO147_00750 [Clostridia bacterium]|nr:hypothetical protein [Clostridia bacterium]
MKQNVKLFRKRKIFLIFFQKSIDFFSASCYNLYCCCGDEQAIGPEQKKAQKKKPGQGCFERIGQWLVKEKL